MSAKLNLFCTYICVKTHLNASSVSANVGWKILALNISSASLAVICNPSAASSHPSFKVSLDPFKLRDQA